MQKSIYDKLVNVEGIPSSILTYSDKNDCIIIEVQDYDKSVFKFAQKFFNGYKSVDIDYTNENKTSVWYNDVSEYSDRETIDSITRFYYDMKVKGLVESKKSARKSLKEDSLDDIIPMGHSEYFDTLVEFFKDNDVPIRISHTVNGGKICYVENDMEFITVIFKSPKRGYELLKTIEMYADGSTYLSRGKGGAWHSNHIPLEEVYVWDMDKDKFVNYKGKVLKNINYDDIVESKKSARKSIKEYNYDSHNKSWVSDSVEKVYTNGLEYKNDWCTLSLYKDEYENLVNYLLDEKGFILEKKYTKKLGYDVFINEKLDLYVVIINETTYGFFDEKHFIIRFGDELGIETPSEFVEKTLKRCSF